MFVPISDRFQTNSENVVFSVLYAWLAYWHSDAAKVEDTVERLLSAAEYRGAFQDYLRSPLPDGRRLLVVMDGLDEASGWETRAGLFPTQAPAHLKVLVAAREAAGPLDWATRLGWRIPGDAAIFGLEGLSREGLAEVLARMGDPLAGLQVNFDFLDKLYELTDQGDPLLVGLYVDALRNEQGKSPVLRPKDLQELKPGLGHFFDFWYDQQKRLWKENNNLTDSQAVLEVDTLLNALATAHGPLTAQDVAVLAPEIFPGTSGVRHAADALQRFLVGTGKERSGYRFSHPRFGQYFHDTLPKGEQDVWAQQYLAYGADTLAKLEGGALEPEDASEYVVRYYRLHLEAHARTRSRLGTLMCRGWLRAWQQREEGEEGFLNDVQAAMEYAANAGPEWLGQVIRGALCFASVREVGANANGDLLALAVAKGAINEHMGLFLVRSKLDPYDRSVGLLAIANALGHTKNGDLLNESLAAAREIDFDFYRSEAMCAVAERLPAQLALSVAREITLEPNHRVVAMCAIAERLPAEESREVLREALAVAHAIDSTQNKVSWVHAAVRHTQEEAQGFAGVDRIGTQGIQRTLAGV